jgi:hypothetical protein
MFGEWSLVRIKGRGKSNRGTEWLLLKHRDEFANDKVDVTEVAPRDRAISNKLLEDIGGENVWESNRKAATKRAPTLATVWRSHQVVESSSRRVGSISTTRRLVGSTPRRLDRHLEQPPLGIEARVLQRRRKLEPPTSSTSLSCGSSSPATYSIK